MKKVLASLIALGAVCIFATGCTCTEKVPASKDQSEVASTKDYSVVEDTKAKPAAKAPEVESAADVPMDHPAH